MPYEKLVGILKDNSLSPMVRIAQALDVLGEQVDVAYLQQELDISQTHAYRVIKFINHSNSCEKPVSRPVIQHDRPIAPYTARESEVEAVSRANAGRRDDVVVTPQPMFHTRGASPLDGLIDTRDRKELPEKDQADPHAELVPMWMRCFARRHSPYPQNKFALNLFHVARRYFSKEEIEYAMVQAGQYAMASNLDEGRALLALRRQLEWAAERNPTQVTHTPKEDKEATQKVAVIPVNTRKKPKTRDSERLRIYKRVRKDDGLPFPDGHINDYSDDEIIQTYLSPRVKRHMDAGMDEDQARAQGILEITDWDLSPMIQYRLKCRIERDMEAFAWQK